MSGSWFWPDPDHFNDFPDPVGFEAEWFDWPARISEGMSTVAEIFSREYIQNSYDSILAKRSETKAGKNLDGGIEFHFVRLEGEDLQLFLQNSGVGELRTRYRALGPDDRARCKLGESVFLTSPVAPGALEILVCSEAAGIGMYGHWWTGGRDDLSGSRLKYATIQSHSEKGDAGAALGSWGHGKKAVAGASRCRTLIVSTAYEARYKSAQQELDGSEPVTRRVLGVSYWAQHALHKITARGAGMFGRRVRSDDPAWANNFMPLDNDAADSYANGLGLDVVQARDISQGIHCGTTYLVIEPAFSPEELARSVASNWWPLLESEPGFISVRGFDGEELVVDPASQKHLQPFISAFRKSVGGLPIREDVEYLEDLRLRYDGKREPAGMLALTSDTDPGGWSYDDFADNTNVVALIRSNMVIAYQKFPLRQLGSQPFVRGVFVVDHSKNEIAAKALRLTEPHLHNEWRTEGNDVSQENRDFSRGVLKTIQIAVNELRNKLKADTREREAELEEFSSVWIGGTRGKTKPPKPKPGGARYFSIQFTESVELLAGSRPDLLKVRAKMRLKLQNKPYFMSGGKKITIPAQMKVKVLLGWSVLEDGLSKDAILRNPSAEIAPAAFTKSISGGYWEGVINKTGFVEFEWTSNEFSNVWTVAPTPEVEKA
jgi:hypothetical protein